MNIIRCNQLATVQEEGLCVLKKNMDNGCSSATPEAIGSIIRLGEKINKLSTVTKNDLMDTKKIRKALMDIHNYAAMAFMLLDESPLIHPRIRELKKQSRVKQTMSTHSKFKSNHIC